VCRDACVTRTQEISLDYATIMVHCELGQPNAGLLRIAGDLAERFNAGVIGLSAIQPLQAVYDDGMYIAADLIDDDRGERAKELLVAESEFRSALSGRCKTLDWRSTVTVLPLSHYAARQARSADLIITGIASPSVLDATRRVDVGDLILQAGRPVLVVPAETSSLKLDRMMVAWKDTREARRAVTDALPLLKRASDVFVVSIAKDAQRDVDDVASWLEAHGVAAQAHALIQDGDNGTQLQQFARQNQVDLTIAGAYGHSRLREWAMGGVTRDLLSRQSGCSLLSH
jgi:nucleotide-binding universal stress UspA family protein